MCWKELVGGARVAALGLVVALVAAPVTGAAGEAGKPGAERAALNLPELEERLGRELTDIANRRRRFESQQRDIQVVARIDPARNSVFLEIGEEYGAISNEVEMEDLVHELAEDARLIIGDAFPQITVEFLFGGKDMYYYHPEEWTPPRAENQPTTGWSPRSDNVLIAAGHGVYFHHKFKDWRAQRGEVNGIVEDFMTPRLARELQYQLFDRAFLLAGYARANTDETHEPSGNEWLQMGSRYHLENILPNAPEVWHSLPDAMHDLRERSEDLQARPLYANFSEVAALIHLHTNAAEPAATGARIFYHPGREADRRMANAMLCSMKEIIHSKKGYADYFVPDAAVADAKYVENRLAKMPSVIVEVGFHTNPTDAQAILDPTFRAAAMGGVAKGYRMFLEGKECHPFEIGPIAAESGSWAHPAKISIPYKGNPQFYLKMESDITNCPSNVLCPLSKATFYTSGSPLEAKIECPKKETFIANVQTTLRDEDGVEATVNHEVLCIGSSDGSNAISKALDRQGESESIR